MVGVLTIFVMYAEQILCPWGYTDTFAGTFCLGLAICSGLIGSIVIGRLTDKTERTVEITKGCTIIASVSMAALVATQVNSLQTRLLVPQSLEEPEKNE